MQMKVERAIYGGAFATDAGETLPFVLPGEVVERAPDGAVAIIEAAAERVTPGCVHFGVCGGCSYQHADYSAQVRIKRGILEGLFAEGGLVGMPPAISVSAAEPWGYRNRIRLRVEAGEVGYSRRGTNAFLPVRMCPIAAPVLWRAAEALRTLAANDARCGRWLAAASEVEFFATAEESRVQMQLFLRDAGPAKAEPKGFDEVCGRLQGAVPEFVGAGAVLDPELNRRVRRRWDGVAWGAAGLGYEAAGRSYWVSRGAFFQVNRFLVERLVELATGGTGGALAWDLYAGVGLFTRALAERFDQVVAVEGGEAAAADLARGAKKYEAVESSALDFLKARRMQRERPELVVLDPPRAGLGIEGAALLAEIGPKTILYVSCDPVTLTRDLAVLMREGYGVAAVELIDLFPQTFHLETVVRLVRV